MARDTLPRIRESALELFSERWFGAVSVAEICRRAEVSNGVFYRYYRTKDELFASLVDDFLDKFATDLRAVGGSTLPERVQNFIVVVTGAARRYAGQVTMFREGQYRDRHYEDTLRSLYIETLEGLYGRSVSEVEYLYLISGIRFLATRSLYHDIAIDTAMVRDLIVGGIFPDSPAEIQLSPLPGPEPMGQTGAAARLAEAGMELMGKDGFHPVQVADVVRHAGYSVGTFYKHYESKEAFLGFIVDEIGHRTRRYLAEHVPMTGPRWSQEVLGMWSFLNYFSRHPVYYQIVREAEFVVPERVRQYYNAFESGYCENLPDHAVANRPVVANFLMGISHYLGIEILFAERITDAEAVVRQLGRLLTTGIPE
jgi:AcrR family transcriptional regulator